jgi:hypothetical protein
MIYQFFLIAVLFLMGCIINPKYTDPKAIADEQAQKYPRNADQIKQQYNDFKTEQNLKNSQPSPDSSYTVSQNKTSSWSVGDPNAAIHLGVNKYQYNHRINITLVCDKNSFYPKPYSKKKITWKLSETQQGTTETNLKGEINLRPSLDTNERFHSVTVTTAKHTYDIGLDGLLVFELKKDECE